MEEFFKKVFNFFNEMSNYEIVSLFVGVIGAIITFSAVMVALFQYKLMYKQRIKCKIGVQHTIEADGKCFSFLILKVINAGVVPIYIENAILVINRQPYYFVPQRIKEQFKITTLEFPIKVEPNSLITLGLTEKEINNIKRYIEINKIRRNKIYFTIKTANDKTYDSKKYKLKKLDKMLNYHIDFIN